MSEDTAPQTAAPAAPQTADQYFDAAEAAAEAAVESTESTETAETSTDPFEDPKIEQFDRKYVEKLRKEAADRRTALREWESSFEGFVPEDQKILRDAIQLAASDPVAGSETLREIADLLHKSAGVIKENVEPSTQASAGKKVEDENPEFLTPEDLENFYKSKKNEEAQEAAVTAIFKEAHGLGYEDNTPEMTYLLSIAHQEKVSVADAHAKIEGRKQAIIDEYLNGRRSDAEKGGALGDLGAPPSQREAPKNVDDAGKALLEALKSAG